MRQRARVYLADARVYVRVSRPDETTILKNQRTGAISHVHRSNYKLIRIYSDVASGAKEDRDGFNELLRDVRRGEIVVFTSLSRMTRGGIAAALDTLRRLEAMGVGWNFVEQPILNFDSTTPKLVKDILLAVMAAVDEDYRRRISEATRSSYRRKKRAADSVGSKVRWGRKPGKLPRCVKCGKSKSAKVHDETEHPFRAERGPRSWHCRKCTRGRAQHTRNLHKFTPGIATPGSLRGE